MKGGDVINVAGVSTGSNIITDISANDNTEATDFVLPNALQNKTLQEVFENDYLSETELAALIAQCANDNFTTLPTDPIANDADLDALLNQVSNRLNAKMTVLKASPLTDEEYMKQLRKVQIEAAFLLLTEYLIGQDIKSIKGQKVIKKISARLANDDRRTYKYIVKE